MDTILATLLTLACALIGWGFILAYQCGRILAKVEDRLDSNEKRIAALESLWN